MMKPSRVYELFQHYKRLEKDGFITCGELQVLRDFIEELMDINSEQFVERYNAWLRKNKKGIRKED